MMKNKSMTSHIPEVKKIIQILIDLKPSELKTEWQQGASDALNMAISRINKDVVNTLIKKEEK